MKTVLFIVIMLMSLAQNSKAGIKDSITHSIDYIFGGFLEETSDVVVSSASVIKKEQKGLTSSIERCGNKKGKDVVPEIREVATGKKLKCSVHSVIRTPGIPFGNAPNSFLFCERVNPETGKLELFAHILGDYKDAAEFLRVYNDSAYMPATLTSVSTTTIRDGDVAAIVVRKPRPKEEEKVVAKVEVPEAPIRGDLVISTPTPSVEVHGNSVVNNTTLAPEPEVSNKPFLPPVVEAARDHQLPETTSLIGNQAMKERGFWVVNKTLEDFRVVLNVNENGKSLDVDMGMLGRNQEMFLPCPLDFISLTIKMGGWFHKDISRALTKKDSIDQVNVILKQDGSVVETPRENI